MNFDHGSRGNGCGIDLRSCLRYLWDWRLALYDLRSETFTAADALEEELGYIFDGDVF